MPRPDTLHSTRLTLRPPSLSDADRIYQLVHLPEILRWTGIPFKPYRREHAVRFINAVHGTHRKGNAWHWSIRWRDTDDLIGVVSLNRSERAPLSAEIGCWLGKPFWGQGIMSEAFELALAHAFRKLKFERIYAYIFTGNKRSEGLVKSLGFVFEGHMRRTRKVRGRWCDEELYAILKSDWRARK